MAASRKRSTITHANTTPPGSPNWANTPFGSALNAALLAVLPLIFGLPGIPLAALGGVLCTALLLMRRQALLGALPWARLWLLNALAMALAAGLLFRIDGIWLQLGLGTVAGCLALLGMALWLRPWRTD